MGYITVGIFLAINCSTSAGTSRCSPPAFLMCDERVRVLRQAALRLGDLEVVSATAVSA